MCVAVCNVHDRAPCAAVRQQHRLTHVQHVVRKSTKVLRGCHLFLRCEHYTLQRHKNPKPKPKARGCNSTPAWFQGRTTRWAAWSTARERPDSCGRSPESAGKCRLHPPRSGKFRCLWETATPGGKSASVGAGRASNGTLVMQQFLSQARAPASKLPVQASADGSSPAAECLHRSAAAVPPQTEA